MVDSPAQPHVSSLWGREGHFSSDWDRIVTVVLAYGLNSSARPSEALGGVLEVVELSTGDSIVVLGDFNTGDGNNRLPDLKPNDVLLLGLFARPRVYNKHHV